MKYVTYESVNRIGFITLNRAEKRNSLSHELVGELKECFRKAEADDTVKVIVLKAHGEAFCAGADLAYLQDLQKFSYQQNLDDSNDLKELFLTIYSLKKIVIAEVQGHALAGGCGLATICDFVYSVPEAKFGYTEVKIGFIPAIVMVFLLRKIGEGKAKQLLLSGDLVSSQEALQLGLINKVVSKETLSDEVGKFAKHLIESNSASSMMMTKQMIAQVQSMKLDDALSFASEMNAKARATDDCKKGIDSFLRKEKMNW
jgi:methylglutaconyl-CoA hydratase